MSLFDFFLQEFGGAGLDDDTTADTRTAITEAETDASVSAASSNRSGVLVDREDVTAPPPVSNTAHVDDLSDIASNELNSVAPTEEEDVSSAAAPGIEGAPRSASSDDTTISSVSMDDLSSLASLAPNGEDNSLVEEVPGPVIMDSVPSAEDQGSRWNRLRLLPNLRPQSESSDPNGQTILSSTPSEADEDVDALSSAPSLSLSPSDIDSAVDTPSSLDTFSAVSSMKSDDYGEEESDAVSATDLPKSPHGDPWPAEPTGHAGDVFYAVGNSLLLPSRDASSSNPQGSQANNNIEWWKYLSEKDWERLRSQAESILDSMETNDVDEVASLPLPPPKPPANFLNTFEDLPSLSQDVRRSIVDALPPEFFCPICEDIILGAVVVGCGCPRSTCCFRCADNGARKPSAEPSAPEIEEINEDEDDYVMVERPSDPTKRTENQDHAVKSTADMNEAQIISCGRATCPCGKADSLIVPCHALDVAIYNAINSLSSSLSSEQGDGLRAFQYYYYRRLEDWRADLLSRRKALEDEKDHRRQKMLAMLIEAEEEALWSDKLKKRRQQDAALASGGEEIMANAQGKEMLLAKLLSLPERSPSPQLLALS
eukprot:CAMPEP_0185827292 /NCGR_PEP_ID=MMETSP1322-20130828/31978_1 /TAXON_ID=265543 /ORGANISM="Minutocellus polymorphus, Strain RCC2270" /LENGTH=598 /DNA_ID=CAMNT_0028525025 /DNA_START=58 /DNA_END=1855 /DNA_ORIENTATION=+